ncbi:hypothetical protein J2787_001990 [Chryseobacterium rhizosphaerae]|uniref:Glycine zipper family protein n=1 Tax=Chryseobacterium rhizosphaerae TaxID=395937 RepID=A0AAE4C4E7_9FLAO|nr:MULTISPECIES: hypothetical protein [Chryseobacterium]MDR6526610.1 hypothetical protein [Chryseobacterium rhizosphaerae]MDR6548800.1 hypothetical protein [Chryseobacterium rhizosphaerae]
MKKNVLFILFSIFISAQKNQFIELRNNIKDKNHVAESLTLLDKREDKTIGIVSHRKEPYQVKFEKEDLEKLFSDWFLENNKKLGKTQYFLMLEHLKVKDIPGERSVTGHLEMQVSTFLKRNNKYYFLKKNRISKDYPQKDHAYITRAIAAKISSELANIVKDSYAETGLNIPVSENDLENYGKIISEQLPVYSSQSFTDGVYRDYKSFAEQKPDKELTVKKNKDGMIKGVKRIDGYDNLSKDVFAIIDNGIAYKKTPTSIIEIEKDNEGYFITASEEEIFPKSNTAVYLGAGVGGVIGGLVVAVIDITASKIRKQNALYYRVGIDILTGDYILPENFDKTK